MFFWIPNDFLINNNIDLNNIYTVVDNYVSTIKVIINESELYIAQSIIHTVDHTNITQIIVDNLLFTLTYIAIHEYSRDYMYNIIQAEPVPAPDPAPDPAPVPTPQPTPPISNRPGPIQFCNSRFAKCNINKKLGAAFQSGNVSIQGTTIPRRISQAIRVQTYLKNANFVIQDVSLNVYGQRSGGPYGYGSSPKNTF